MEFRKWDDHDNACTTCIIYETCFDEEQLDKCTSINPKYYAHKDDISAMVEWAEEGYLVVCNKYEEGVKCNNCDHAKPHKHTGVCLSVCCGEKIDCIAYRGEDPKLEDVREYVVVKHISIDTMSESAINPSTFLEVFRVSRSLLSIPARSTIDKSSVIYKNAAEFEELGFIEEKVHDPVANLGDVFKKNNSYFVIAATSNNTKHMLTFPELKICSEAVPNSCIQKLSMYLWGHNKVKDFKKVEIKITEVKD